MKEPFTVRLSDSDDPHRATKFQSVLERRGANPTDVIRKLVDAYIASLGDVPFPVRLEEAQPKYKLRRGAA